MNPRKSEYHQLNISLQCHPWLCKQVNKTEKQSGSITSAWSMNGMSHRTLYSSWMFWGKN